MAQVTKAEIIEQLTTAGIAHDPEATVAALKALLPDAPAKAKKTEVTVTWNNGTRVFSQAVHGDDFADLADEFVATHADKGAAIVA